MEESWKELAQQLLYEMNPQNNWHGTPYDFNKFNDSKWLSGEGFAAHGPGHYSADQFSTADTYNPHEGYRVYNKSAKKYLEPTRYKVKSLMGSVDLNDIADWIDNYLNSGEDSPYINKKIANSNSILKDILENPNNYEVRYEPYGNTYRVNVPNENFMWKEGVSLGGQTPYVRDAWYRNNFDYAKLLNYLSVDHDTEGIKLPQDKKFWRAFNKSYDLYGELRPSLKRIFNEQMASLDVPDQLKFLVRSGNAGKIQEAMGGIKGIRAIGQQDGPINVTFSGKNIKMANTPIQRVVNRIPTQTLGKMAKKLMESPAVRIGGKILEGSATPLMILDMLQLQGIDPRAVLDKNYRNKLIQQNKNRIY